MTPEEFRRIALGMRGVSEGEHMAHPDFRANGRIFATLAFDAQWGMIKLTPEQQMEFVRADPDTFVPAAGAWGRGGSTMVRLAAADSDAVGEAMTLAGNRGDQEREAEGNEGPAIVDDLANILFGVVGLVILWALTEGWRLQWQAKRKRGRQNRTRPGA